MATNGSPALEQLPSGNVELIPDPNHNENDDHDTVKCVCESNEENGDMLQCKSCSAWCHNICVSISPQVAANFPFICPFCIKEKFSLIPKLRSEISHLKALIIKLERSITSL